jgi:hypothetical protein
MNGETATRLWLTIGVRNLTDNWLEMTVRFVVPDHGIRRIKDQITRTVLREFDAAGIEVARTSMEVTMMKRG